MVFSVYDVLRIVCEEALQRPVATIKSCPLQSVLSWPDFTNGTPFFEKEQNGSGGHIT